MNRSEEQSTSSLLTCIVSDDFLGYLQRIDPHDSLRESPKPIYVQYRRISLSSASEFLLYDHTSYHFMYGTILVFFSSEHDKTISFAGAAVLIKRKFLQSTTISDADGSERKRTLST